MDITLYYVEGISESDTPYFATITKQQEFFSNHVVVPSIESSYYPPNYYNEISFDTDDIDVNTKANYLSFDYNNKVYYYFIDAIEYTSENVITLKVKLDAFQTYLFNFNIVGGYIERKFINRWEDTGNINRNYVRENPSNNLFTKHEKSKYITNDIIWMIFKYKITGEDNIPTAYPIFSYQDKYAGQSSTRLMIIPVISQYKIKGLLTTEFKTVYDNYLTQLGYYANTYDIYFFSYCPVEGITVYYNFSTEIYEISSSKYVCQPFRIDDKHEYVYGYECSNVIFSESSQIAPFSRVPIKNYITKYGFDFVKNTKENIPYNSAYAPVLMDTNFYDYNFGNCNQLIKYPLEEAKLPILYNKFYMEVVTGNVIICIDDIDVGFNLKNTLAIDTNVVHYEIINDSWQQYREANKFRWIQAFATGGTDIASDVSRPLLSKTSMDRKIAFIRTQRKYRTPVRKQVSTWGKRQEEAYQGEIQNLIGNAVVSGATHLLSNAIGFASSSANAAYAPSSIRQTGNSSCITYDAGIMFTYVSKVDNYDECAWYFHRNGYLVNEPITDKNNTLDYVITRHYFNIVKYNDIEVHLNILESNDITDMIKERLLQGIRMWNTDYGEIGDFRYDNVETKYL